MSIIDSPTAVTEAETLEADAEPANGRERILRGLIIVGAVALAIFIVYLLLVLAFPSMNIGMNP